MAKKTKPTRKRTRERNYEGPAEWILPMMEETYSRLELKGGARAIARPKKAARRARRARGAPAAPAFVSSYQHGQGEEVLARVRRDYWHRTLQRYHERRVKAHRARMARPGPLPAMPAVPGVNNWTPLGPGVIAHAQTGDRGPVSGRVPGIAVAPGGLRVYVASADGGVWRSDDGGRRWRSTMDGFDQNPTNFASASLVCGAIAINPANPDRIYVGTGEGDVDAIFSLRITSALPAYRGIGPVRSDDGGDHWEIEASSPSLAGYAFYQIAVDPADPDHCVGATSNGLYERVPASGGGFEWVRRRAGRHSSVVATRAAGVTRWFAGLFGGGVYASTDGQTWTGVGTGFPAGAGRVALGVQPDNPNVLYAVVANTNGSLNGVRRLDGVAGAWKTVASPPAFLPLDSSGGSQGDYDLCIAVDPNDATRLYLGGSYYDDGAIYPGSIWRCVVSPSGSAYTMTSAAIGQNAHADVHTLVHAPGDSNTLWTGTDGGVFVNTNPTAGGGFEARNTGLHTLCVTFVAQHPTEPAVAYVGLQDNGSAKYTGEQAWRHVLYGDGGYGVVNWHDPFRVMLYANGNVYRCTDGARDWSSWTIVTPSGAQWVMMAAPLVTTPYNPGTPAEAGIVAYGAGYVTGTYPLLTLHPVAYISSDFGNTWPAGSRVELPAGTGGIFSMVFASATRLYVGTTNGRVYRLDKGATWAATRIDNAAGGALPFGLGLVADIAVDWSDATGNSVFICFGGTGDQRHVWRYDGTAWQARSGTAGSGTELLDVEHNALQYDRVTNRVYVGADIGVWESADGGNTWTPLQNGLPDAPVYDIQIHPTARLMRAALHGRGVWEWKLDAPVLPDVELYIRDTMLDTGRGENTDGRDDPSIFPTAPVHHYLSPNIKVDVPTPMGYQTPTTDIDFLTFNTVIEDGSGGVGTNAPPPTVHNRVYAEVHNRGRADATDVRVMAVVTNAGTGLGLPGGYTANVVSGTPLPGPKWVTLGAVTIPVVRAGSPEIVHFDLPSTVLPLPASLPGDSHWCMAVFLHCAQDPFTSTITNVDALTLADRKVGQQNLTIVQFVGTPPPPGTGIGMWTLLWVSGAHFKEKGLVDLVFDLERFKGTVYALLPPPLMPKADRIKGFRKGAATVAKAWLAKYPELAKRAFYEAKYSTYQYEVLTSAMKAVSRATPLAARGGEVAELLGLTVGPTDEYPVFLRIDLPRGTKVGTRYEIDVTQRDSRSKRILGGARVPVVVNRPVQTVG